MMIFSVPVGGPMDGYVDDLFRAAPSASAPTTAPTANNLNANAVRGEMNRLFTRSLRKGSDFSPADQTYVAQVLGTPPLHDAPIRQFGGAISRAAH
jgi:hypothetical protein